jgi:AcrR family transcriptional regulator
MPDAVPRDTPRARERILAASYDLFAARGVRDVGIDEIIADSGVAKATLYRHFPSKDALAIAFLQRREREWTHGVMSAGIAARSDHPEGRLLAIFDLFDQWFRRDDYEACPFITVMFEMGPTHPVGAAGVGHLAEVRTIVRGLAAEAGLREPEEFAHSWHILMKGSIVSATEGDREAARRARSMAHSLVESHRQSAREAISPD